jgi:hypothetical protein
MRTRKVSEERLGLAAELSEATRSGDRRRERGVKALLQSCELAIGDAFTIAGLVTLSTLAKSGNGTWRAVQLTSEYLVASRWYSCSTSGSAELP